LREKNQMLAEMIGGLPERDRWRRSQQHHEDEKRSGVLQEGISLEHAGGERRGRKGARYRASS
jgi:hypothetical protein